MAVRARAAGIRIALVDGKGRVTEIGNDHRETHLDLAGALEEMV